MGWVNLGAYLDIQAFSAELDNAIFFCYLPASIKFVSISATGTYGYSQIFCISDRKESKDIDVAI